MNIIDEKLILLKDYLKKDVYVRQNVAEHMGITTRQLSRKMSKWSEDGIISYTSGSGRGNTTEVVFNVDVEQLFVNHIIANLESHALKDLDHFLDLPISETYKQILEYHITDFVIKKKLESSNDTVFIEYLSTEPILNMPQLNLNHLSRKVFMNIGDRLYRLNARGEIVRNLVKYDIYESGTLEIFIYSDIKFSDGFIVYASDVVNILHEGMKYKKNQPFESIEVTGLFSLKIISDLTEEQIKHVLTDVALSIYKVMNGSIIATGKYKITHNTKDTLHLSHNPYYFRDMPDITDVFLIADFEKYLEYQTLYDGIQLPYDQTYLRYYFITSKVPKHIRMTLNQLLNLVFNKHIDKHVISLYKDAAEVDSYFKHVIKVAVIRGKHIENDHYLLFKFIGEIEITFLNLDEWISSKFDPYAFDIVCCDKEMFSFDVLKEHFKNEKVIEYYKHYFEINHVLQFNDKDMFEKITYIEKLLTEEGLMMPIRHSKIPFDEINNYRNLYINQKGVLKYGEIVVL